MIRSILVSLLVATAFGGVMYLAIAHPDTVSDGAVTRYFVENYEEDTAARNAVAAIYLNYRVYDTLFEALLLLIAIVGIVHFFKIGAAIPREKRDE